MLKLPWPPKELNPNARVHWAKKAKAAKKYRRDCYMLAKAEGLQAPETKTIAVSIMFHPPDKRRRDHDNMLAAIKNMLDGVAVAMGVNDVRFFLFYDVGRPVLGGSVEIEINPYNARFPAA